MRILQTIEAMIMQLSAQKNIKRFYSEGFGISDEKVIVTGIPRTDIFFDEEYGEKIINKIYREHPILKNKKVILFAPTFRGEGKDDAYYPKDKFNIETFF
ncbi:CDP-glycerol glycerophosphotransferase family protein [Methanobrevibacter arboriphilus]|uniref:CDP-glycerol glycerophosphotransferase family protein n=1 Tax=Methanobrevibacter arboriphilus TaxID=39441 RepID=UPI00373FD410